MQAPISNAEQMKINDFVFIPVFLRCDMEKSLTVNFKIRLERKQNKAIISIRKAIANKYEASPNIIPAVVPTYPNQLKIDAFICLKK
jgi:hypothetical protein